MAFYNVQNNQIHEFIDEVNIDPDSNIILRRSLRNFQLFNAQIPIK